MYSIYITYMYVFYVTVTTQMLYPEIVSCEARAARRINHLCLKKIL